MGWGVGILLHLQQISCVLHGSEVRYSAILSIFERICASESKSCDQIDIVCFGT